MGVGEIPPQRRKNISCQKIREYILEMSMSMSMSVAIFSVAQIVKLLQGPRKRAR